MQLYCVRHGEANVESVDPQRGLTEQGIVEITKIAHFMRRSNVTIEHILHSDKMRAKQTATIFNTILRCPQVTESGLLSNEEGDVLPLANMIHSWTEPTLLVGHLPFMSRLVSALVTENDRIPVVNFSPGTIVSLENYEPTRWVINWILSPKIIVS